MNLRWCSRTHVIDVCKFSHKMRASALLVNPKCSRSSRAISRRDFLQLSLAYASAGALPVAVSQDNATVWQNLLEEAASRRSGKGEVKVFSDTQASRQWGHFVDKYLDIESHLESSYRGLSYELVTSTGQPVPRAEPSLVWSRGHGLIRGKQARRLARRLSYEAFPTDLKTTRMYEEGFNLLQTILATGFSVVDIKAAVDVRLRRLAEIARLCEQPALIFHLPSSFDIALKSFKSSLRDSLASGVREAAREYLFGDQSNVETHPHLCTPSRGQALRFLKDLAADDNSKTFKPGNRALPEASASIAMPSSEPYDLLRAGIQVLLKTAQGTPSLGWSATEWIDSCHSLMEKVNSDIVSAEKPEAESFGSKGEALNHKERVWPNRWQYFEALLLGCDRRDDALLREFKPRLIAIKEQTGSLLQLLAAADAAINATTTAYTKLADSLCESVTPSNSALRPWGEGSSRSMERTKASNSGSCQFTALGSSVASQSAALHLLRQVRDRLNAILGGGSVVISPSKAEQAWLTKAEIPQWSALLGDDLEVKLEDLCGAAPGGPPKYIESLWQVIN